MRTLLHLISLTLLLAGLSSGKALAQYYDGPIDLRMWVAASYVSQTGTDGPGDPAEHRWDWEFEDDLTGNLGSIPGCIGFTSSSYTGGWHNHSTKLIKSYLNIEKTPSTINWIASGENGSSYWEEDASGNCHYSARGDEALCMLGNVGAPINIRSATPPHTYGFAELFSAGGCSLGARLRIFYTTPAPASATGPDGVLAPGTIAHFTATPPLGSVEGGWASVIDYDYEIETEPGSGVFELACYDCSGDVDIPLPNRPGTYRMRVRADYTSGDPSRGYVELIVKIDGEEEGEGEEGGEGLPSPWTGTTIGEGSSDFSYESSGQSFGIQTAANNDGLFGDNFGFINTQLCGDGEILVKIENIEGPGYGGVAIRETNAPNARGVAMFSNLSSTLRWEHRNRGGGAKQSMAFGAISPQWLRLIRWGDWAFGYSSPDGVRFFPVNTVYIGWSECVNIGFGAFSDVRGVPSTVVFSNVSISGNTAPRPNPGNNPVQSSLEGSIGELSLFPNPASDNLTIEFAEVVEQPASLRLRNELGQLIEQGRLEVPTKRTEWDISRLNPGMYFIEIHTEGQLPQVLRFLKK